MVSILGQKITSNGDLTDILERIIQNTNNLSLKERVFTGEDLVSLSRKLNPALVEVNGESYVFSPNGFLLDYLPVNPQNGHEYSLVWDNGITIAGLRFGIGVTQAVVTFVYDQNRGGFHITHHSYGPKVIGNHC